MPGWHLPCEPVSLWRRTTRYNLRGNSPSGSRRSPRLLCGQKPSRSHPWYWYRSTLKTHDGGLIRVIGRHAGCRIAVEYVEVVIRRSFGIESSYRCVRKARAWTTSRNPTLRFLLITPDFLLVNLWKELGWRFCQVIRHRRRLDADRFKLQRLANFPNRAIEAIYSVPSFIETDVRPPPVKPVIY